MMHGRMLWIALMVVGFVVAPGVAAADLAPQVPEPSTLSLLVSGAALGGVGWLFRRKK